MNPDPQHIVDSVDALKIYFDPFRQRIIAELAGCARTIHEVADRLNVPFTRLYYQFNLLEQHGIIRVVDTRGHVGAVEEKLYRISAYSFRIPRHFLDPNAPDPIPSTLHVVLDTVFDDVRSEIERSLRNQTINLAVTAPHADALLMQRAQFRMLPQEAVAFQEELLTLLRRYAPGTVTPDHQTYTFTVAFAPITPLPEQPD